MPKNFFQGLFSAPDAGDAIEGKLLCYDWRLDGQPAVFGVDMRLCARAPIRSLPVLAYVGFLPAGGGELDGKTVAKALKFIKKCAKELELSVAGYIETKDELQYYIYLASVADYERMKALASEEKCVECRVGGRTEPDWSSYFTVLYPDDAKRETVRNGEIIAELYSKGDSEAPRRINLHLAFPTDAARAAFASDALSEGFATGDSIDGSEGNEDCPFELSVHRICALKKWDIDALTVHAIRIAEKHGGRLLYLDCPIVPERL